ncbi:hypothetical protein KO527_19840 [Pseudoalteromonas sp. C2R02]|uniref:hypothetical protein n=1 Tax=Pseudoalteromonas sp. C2R02 TaxID=2841565 RepID=UPI001C0916C2|nr:hypothetical protein [Pseudoalteromonas sp. C2R02]MBU2971603.1 hypothetical protein [Pseudoalteromonas sp. C2R02]
MTNKFENIESEEIKLNKNGEIELSPELADAVSGGFNPEQEDEEAAAKNKICGLGCAEHQA